MNPQVSIFKRTLSVKLQTLAAITAIVAAVALPQFFHMLGAALGIGSALGEALLPMHFPILLVGFLAGPYAGAIAGLCSPLISFWLTGMPKEALLPFMMIELCIYGLTAGLLRQHSFGFLPKLLLAQLGGRLIRSIAILIVYYTATAPAIAPAYIWNSVITGWIGILLQMVFIPLILKGIEGMSHHE